MLNCRPKVIVYVSCIKFLGSCMYRYTRYTTISCIVFRTLIDMLLVVVLAEFAMHMRGIT